MQRQEFMKPAAVSKSFSPVNRLTLVENESQVTKKRETWQKETLFFFIEFAMYYMCSFNLILGQEIQTEERREVGRRSLPTNQSHDSRDTRDIFPYSLSRSFCFISFLAGPPSLPPSSFSFLFFLFSDNASSDRSDILLFSFISCDFIFMPWWTMRLINSFSFFWSSNITSKGRKIMSK